MNNKLSEDLRYNVTALSDITADIPASGYLLKALPDFNVRKLHCGFAIELYFVGTYFACVDNHRKISMDEVSLLKSIFKDFIPEGSEMWEASYISLPSTMFKVQDLYTAPYALDVCLEMDNQRYLSGNFFDSLTMHVYETYDVFLNTLIDADGKRKLKEEFAYQLFLENLQQRIEAKAQFPFSFN